MRVTAIVILIFAASVSNLVVTGFTQDAAFRSFEALEQNSSRYSFVGAVIVPFAAEHTAVQFVAAGLPVLIGVLTAWRRWPLAVATTLVMAIELLVAAWSYMVHALAVMPFG